MLVRRGAAGIPSHCWPDSKLTLSLWKSVGSAYVFPPKAKQTYTGHGSNSIPRCIPNQRKLCPAKALGKNVHGYFFIIGFEWKWFKQPSAGERMKTLEHIHPGEDCTAGRKQSPNTRSSVKGPQSYNVDWEKSDAEEHILHNSTYMQLKTRQNYGLRGQSTGWP